MIVLRCDKLSRATKETTFGQRTIVPYYIKALLREHVQATLYRALRCKSSERSHRQPDYLSLSCTIFKRRDHGQPRRDEESGECCLNKIKRHLLYLLSNLCDPKFPLLNKEAGNKHPLHHNYYPSTPLLIPPCLLFFFIFEL